MEKKKKRNNVKKETGHLNIADAALKRIKRYCGKKTKDIIEKEKKIQIIF